MLGILNASLSLDIFYLDFVFIISQCYFMFCQSMVKLVHDITILPHHKAATLQGKSLSPKDDKRTTSFLEAL